MKKILFAALAATTLFTACNKENNLPNEDNNVLVVTLPADVATRAVEAQVGNTTATTVTNAEVFLINAGSGAVVKRVTFAETVPGSKSMRIEEVSSTVTKVVVVANIPSAELSAVQALTSYSAITGFAFTTAGQNANAGIESKTLMGEGVPATAIDPDAASHEGHGYKTVSINLNALTARFEIGTVKAGDGVESVELLGVWINSYYTDGSKVAPTTAVTGFNDQNSTYWLTTPATSTSPATTDFSTVTLTNAYSPAEYYNAASGDVTLAAASKVYAFHVFAGANIPHVIMLVRGEYTDSVDGKKFFLGWLTFTKYLEGATAITSIEANKIYKIGAGATGIEVEAKNITEKPEQTTFDLGIQCVITGWETKNVTPSVN